MNLDTKKLLELRDKYKNDPKYKQFKKDLEEKLKGNNKEDQLSLIQSMFQGKLKELQSKLNNAKNTFKKE